MIENKWRGFFYGQRSPRIQGLLIGFQAAMCLTSLTEQRFGWALWWFVLCIGNVILADRLEEAA